MGVAVAQHRRNRTTTPELLPYKLVRAAVMCRNFTKPCDWKGCIGIAHCRDYPSYCKLHNIIEASAWHEEDDQYNIILGGGGM